jgi:hypothetical protein
VVLKLCVGVLLGLVAPMVVAQDVALNVTYVCNGVPAGMSPYTYLHVSGRGVWAAYSGVSEDHCGGAGGYCVGGAGGCRGQGDDAGSPAGTYYLMISTRYNNQALVWDEAVELKAGENSMALDLGNGRVMH